ncbi:DUF975 family protein [Peptoniphilus sp. oral taxon 386]|uniref:DUF975 family protein n=1 Tax=Peptoniphilus sp. oral taxon 386 TaxID=652713 RepID=UPI0001DAA0E4|nr:DUF975 family protein [Peptoniphilus sp. oral taxon 386]EFI41675.1 hypothetical protein HMPREF0629_00299 [Peptoniphilus sp. oral taxon 386 str. F0131]
MWTRKQLKDNAKIFLRKYLKEAIIVCIIFSILNANINFEKRESHFPFSETKYKYQFHLNKYMMPHKHFLNVKSENSNLPKEGLKLLRISNIFKPLVSIVSAATFTIANSIIVMIIIILSVVKIFILNPIKIGMLRFFIDGYENDNADISNVISAYRDNSWFKLSVKLLLKDIFIALWTLLLIIPGIYKSYEYYFVDYILAENPDLSLGEAISISKEMTDGEKYDIFVLNLSFIGWEILSSLLFGLGVILLTPYEYATYTNLYLFDKKTKLETII